MKPHKLFSTLLLSCLLSIVLLTESRAQTYTGDLILTSQTEVNTFNYTEITGKLRIQEFLIGNITSLDNLSSLTSIGGDLEIVSNTAITNLNGLSNLISVGGSVYISINGALTNLDGLSDLTSLQLLLVYDNAALTNIDGLFGITSLTNLAFEHNTSLTNLDGLSNLTSVSADVYILDGALTNIDGLSGLSTVGGFLKIQQNNVLTNINGLSNLSSVGGFLSIYQNTTLANLNGLSSLNSVGGDLDIENNAALTNINGLTSLTSVGGSVTISYNGVLTNVDGLASLPSVNGDLIIFQNIALTNLDGLSGIVSLVGYLDIEENTALTNLNGLSSLTSVGDLYIANNIALSEFCGLYSLLNGGGLVGTYTVSDNAANPSVQDIIDGGACNEGIDICASIDQLISDTDNLLNTASHRTRRYLQKAISDLEDACKEFNNNTCSKGFNYLESAVKNLDKGNADGVVNGVVDLARSIAEQTLTEAQTHSGNPDVDFWLAKAEDAFSKGDNYNNSKQDKAVNEYGKAWEYATKAIQQSGGNNGGGDETTVIDLSQLISTLQALSNDNGVPRRAKKYLSNALSDLNKAQNYFDNGKINKCFDNMESAANNLMKAGSKGADVTSLLSDLADIARQAAVDKITEAQNYAGDSYVDAQINKAEGEVANGDSKAASGNFDDAINQYGKAWDDAKKAVDQGNGMNKTADNNEVTSDLPDKFELNQNYPNPFNPTTKIRFALPVDSYVSLKVFDALGKVVGELINEELPSGEYTTEFNATNLASGIYYYRLTTDKFVETKKMLLLR